MQALLSRWPNTPKVKLVTTDGFLYPNDILEKEGLLERKGFPESYDGAQLLSFVSDVKAGKRNVRAPVYSHVTYDIVPGESLVIDHPDILILEGLNVLLANRGAKDGRAIPFVSDFFDFSIYLHASEAELEKWFVARFMRLRDTAFRDPSSYFKKYADLDDTAAQATARDIWTRINLRNLRENILPTMPRASLILTKGPSHSIEEVDLRKL
ncbi:MAG: type I pantothenate kinase, partial [Alphaproteobacteria bacterium]|nr:type I pantothenate kinase [Alphaproteobacteria bacterium]